MVENELEAVLTTLNEDQQQRAEALKQARGVLLSKQMFGNSVTLFSAADIVMMAHYIITGETPVEHGGSDEVSGGSEGIPEG